MNRQPKLWKYIKPLSDALLIIASFVAAYYLRYEAQWLRQVEAAYYVPLKVYLPSIVGLTAITLIVLWIEGAYRYRRDRLFSEEFALLLRSSLIGVAATIFIVFLSSPGYYSRLIFGYTGIFMVILLTLSRAIERSVLVSKYRKGIGVTKVVIVGAGEVARSLLRTFYARPELGYQVVGFLDDDPTRSRTPIGRFEALGTTDLIAEVISQQPVDEVIITLPWSAHQKIVDMINLCKQHNKTVRIVPDLYQMTLSRVTMDNLNGIPMMSVREPALRDWQALLKRVMDVLLAMVVLIITSPIIMLTAIAIKLDSPGPVIFSQKRMGKDGRLFNLYKFRSMCADAEAQVVALQEQNEASGPLFKIRNDPRVTRVGKIIRRLSIDELPQFWNVLKGEMSVIGPRPALPCEVDKYESWHKRRLEVAPGITGLWQVSGRSDLTFDEMVLLDIYYIENWSLTLDLMILLKTIPTVISGSGAY